MPSGAKSRMRRTETPNPISIKFCVVVDVPDVVKYANFGDHRLRGFWLAGGQISPSPIDFHRRPYNTLALPCERVMDNLQFLVLVFAVLMSKLCNVSLFYLCCELHSIFKQFFDSLDSGDLP